MTTSAGIGSTAIARLLPDLGAQPGPRYRALSSALAALLLDGRLTDGLRLPSERDLAAELGISRATTTAAYEDLSTQGLMARRRGSGSYLQLPVTARVTGPGSRIARQQPAPGTLNLSVACLPSLPSVMESATLAAAEDIGRFTRQDGYFPYGIDELRIAVAARYSDRGVPTEAAQILITNGAQHGFDLILRSILSPGDRVLTESPTYPGALEAITAHHGRVVPVPLSEEWSWDTRAIENMLAQTAPRLAYLIPDFHNPTGALVDSAARDRVASAARRCGTRLVIDESFIDIDLRPDEERAQPPTPMAALDQSVFSIGSLSKPVWGGLRIGWVRATAADVQRLATVRARADMSGAVVDQLIALRVLADLNLIAGQRRAVLTVQRDLLLAALADQLPGWRLRRPDGGLSAWVELDAPAATPLANLLEQRGVLITPGSRFTVDGALERYLRIPFALPSAELVRAVGIIAAAWHDLRPKSLAQRQGSLITT